MTMAATVEQMEVQHRLWGARIGELEAVGENRRVEAKLARLKRIEDLKSKHRLARIKLDELKAAGTEQWQSLRAGVEQAGHDLEVALRRANRGAGKAQTILWLGSLALAVLWVGALLSSNTLGGYVHVLLLPMLVVVGLRLLRLRRAA